MADIGKRRKLLLTLLDAVYVDTLEEKAIVGIQRKPAFLPPVRGGSRGGQGCGAVPQHVRRPGLRLLRLDGWFEHQYPMIALI